MCLHFIHEQRKSYLIPPHINKQTFNLSKCRFSNTKVQEVSEERSDDLYIILVVLSLVLALLGVGTG